MARWVESWDDGSGGRGDDAKEEARFGEEAVVRVVWAREGRGRPSERRFGVWVAIVTYLKVAFKGN